MEREHLSAYIKAGNALLFRIFCNIDMGMMGSLKCLVERRVRWHSNTNPAIKRRQYPFLTKMLRGIIGRGSIQIILVSYIAFCLIVTLLQVIFYKYLGPPKAHVFPGYIDRSLLNDINSRILSTQATLTGIIFPIAVGLVTLILQGRSSHSNPDTQMYYKESLALPVGSSGLGLAAALVFQLFWPFHIAISIMGYKQTFLFSIVLITLAHVGWLLLNIASTWHFLMISLLYIQPHEREKLRERFSANHLIPANLRQNLSEAYLISKGLSLLSNSNLSQYPAISFAFPLSDGDSVIKRHFRHEMMLYDVYMQPLSFAVCRWAKRCRDQNGGEIQARLSFPLCLPGEPGMDFVICKQDGGVELTIFEKWLIFSSFRFRCARGLSSLADPVDILELLANEAMDNLYNRNETTFNDSLRSIASHHRFLVEAYQTGSKAEGLTNYAQLSSWFISIHKQWLQRYYGLCERVTENMDDNYRFFEALTQLPRMLIPTKPGILVSTLLVETLTLPRYLASTLREWRMKQLNIGYRHKPEDASDYQLTLRALEIQEEAVKDVIAAWEYLGRDVDKLFSWKARDISNDDRWNRYRQSLDYLKEHLIGSARLVLEEAWAEDGLALRYYSESLILWPNLWRHELDDTHIPDKILCDLHLASKGWTDASMVINQVSGQYANSITASSLFKAILFNTWQDILVVSASLLLRWRRCGKRQSQIVSQVAWRLLGKVQLEHVFGTKRCREIYFKDIFSTIMRYQVGMSAYSNDLNNFVNKLDAISEVSSEVSFRVYSPTTLSRFDSLGDDLIALLLATVPQTGDGGVPRIVEVISRSEAVLPNGDADLRRLRKYLSGLVTSLGTENFFDHEVLLVEMDPLFNLNAAKQRLLAICSTCLDGLDQVRAERLAERSIDPVNLTLFASSLDGCLAVSHDCYEAFRPFKIVYIDEQLAEVSVTAEINKGQLTTPAMDDLSQNFVQHVTDISKNRSLQQVWRSFVDLPAEQRCVTTEAEFTSLLGECEARIRNLGFSPVILTSTQQDNLPWLDQWMLQGPSTRPQCIEIEHWHNEEWETWDTLINDVRVVRQPNLDRTYIFPSEILAQIRFQRNGHGGISTVSFAEQAGTHNGCLNVSFHQEAVWRTAPIIEVIYGGPPTNGDN